MINYVEILNMCMLLIIILMFTGAVFIFLKTVKHVDNDNISFYNFFQTFMPVLSYIMVCLIFFQFFLNLM